MEFFRLSLRAALCYRREHSDPFKADTEVERLFCYALNPAESSSIDPNPGALLGPLNASGRAVENRDSTGPGQALELEAGFYYFTQTRKTLENRAELAGMAAELQKEGLWERLKLADSLYLRLLHEDGSPVSQLWRRILTSDVF